MKLWFSPNGFFSVGELSTAELSFFFNFYSGIVSRGSVRTHGFCSCPWGIFIGKRTQHCRLNFIFDNNIYSTDPLSLKNELGKTLV